MIYMHFAYARYICHLALVVCAVMISGAAPQVRPSPDGVDAAIEQYQHKIPKIMTDSRVPGVSVALVDADRVLWVQGFGQTDWTGGKPIYAVAQRRKGRVSLLPGLLSMTTGVTGIVGLVLLYVYPALSYTGRLRGRQVLQLWQQVVLLAPPLTAILAVPLIALAGWCWLRRSEPRGARVFLTLITVATVACSAFWWAWGWL